MAIFQIEIEGEDKLAGITAAREKYNEDALAANENAVTFSTDQQYVEFVMNKAAESYKNSYISQE